MHRSKSCYSCYLSLKLNGHNDLSISLLSTSYLLMVVLLCNCLVSTLGKIYQITWVGSEHYINVELFHRLAIFINISPSLHRIIAHMLEVGHLKPTVLIYNELLKSLKILRGYFHILNTEGKQSYKKILILNFHREIFGKQHSWLLNITKSKIMEKPLHREKRER